MDPVKLKELGEKAKAAVHKAEVIRDDARSWAEKQAEFDACVLEATTAQKEVQAIENREKQLANLVSINNFFTKPVDDVTKKTGETDGASMPIGEAFSHYLTSLEPKRKTFLHRAIVVPKDIREECVGVHKEAMRAYILGDFNGMAQFLTQCQIGAKEMHALMSSDNTLGGFLVYEDMRTEIIKAEAGYAVLAPLCRTEPTNSSALVFPKIKPHATDVRRTSGFAGRFAKEAYVTGGTAPTVQNKPEFQRERIPVHSWQPYVVELTPELLDDSGANLESLIAQAIAECLAFDKDDGILSGNGVEGPEGVLYAGISTVNSGGATSIAIGGILGTFSELPAQYRQRSTWTMASRTMGSILQLNTGTGGVYLFPPNQWNNTILGRPVVFMDYGMDTATAAGGTTFTANQKPVIFGDWSRYIIAQRAALRIQRLVERYAPNVAILPTARWGGQVVLTDAFRIMKVAA